MKALKNGLFIFTNAYPYGTGESFIENELKLLSGDYKNIYLFPLVHNGNARTLPAENIKVVCLFQKEKIQKRKLIVPDFLLIIRILFFEFKHTSSFRVFFKSFSEFKSILLANLYRAQLLKDFIARTEKKNNTYYSFWTDEWATVLSILKKKKIIEKFFTRGHGYDVYEERWPNGIIPFRHFQLENVSKFYAVSKYGFNYMIKRYPNYRSKFELSYLTVSYGGENPFQSTNSAFTIVSCSGLIPLKRVELIVQILKNITFEVKWIHFGDGPFMDDLKKMIKDLPATVFVELKGNVLNSEVKEYYRNNCINLFISTSSTEGLPISMQEAISFGIPIIATNVGGVSEIVNENTGILLDPDFKIEDAVEILKEFRNGYMNTPAFRKNVSAYWKEHFSEEINRINFSECD